jgi:hypothetical protein
MSSISNAPKLRQPLDQDHSSAWIMGGSRKEVFPTWNQPVEWLWDEDACPIALVELSSARLKSADQERAAEVQKACEQTGFSQRRDEWTGSVDDHYDYEDYMGYNFVMNLSIIYMTLRNHLSYCPMSLNQRISLLPKTLRLMMTPSLCKMIPSTMTI